jgi:hypothetical protein
MNRCPNCGSLTNKVDSYCWYCLCKVVRQPQIVYIPVPETDPSVKEAMEILAKDIRNLFEKDKQ